MPNQITHQWRVTKYNPAYRDGNGHYTLTEEWTCPSEIGKSFNRKEFTLSEYLQVEEAYVNTAMQFLEESGLATLRILQLSTTWLDKESSLYESLFDQLNLKEDMLVSSKEIPLICKMVLRGLLDCQLYHKETFFIHFGWDYYMYIGSSVNCKSAVQYGISNGLFPEKMKSPYYIAEEQIIRSIQWSTLNDQYKLIVDEEELEDIPLAEIQKVFHLSSEHPVIGTFPITEDQREFFQKHLSHKMDFLRYEYSFCGER